MKLMCRVFSGLLACNLAVTAAADCPWTSPPATSIMYATREQCTSVGIGVGSATASSETAGAKLVIADSAQSVRILLSGQEYFNSAFTSTQGVALMLGINRTGDRQLWIGDSAAMAPDASNAIIRVRPKGSISDISALSTLAGAKNLSFNENGGNIGIALGSFVQPEARLHVKGDLRFGLNGTNTDLRFFTDSAGVLNGTTYQQINSITPVTVPASGITVTALHLKNATVSGGGTNQIDLVVDGNIAAKYQDVAEWVPATVAMRPGTVVVLNGERSNEVMPSMDPYDTAVAGVVSVRPGVLLGEAGPSKAKIATTGRVKVLVDASKAPIHIGDLLVTAAKPGMAMKSEPLEINGRKFHQPGTLIGKALEPLASGEGEILVLLSLH